MRDGVIDVDVATPAERGFFGIQFRVVNGGANVDDLQRFAINGEWVYLRQHKSGRPDAMQYTLPLKEKQIEQSKLEAEARKEATIQNAEADAQAKVIDSKAELERRNLLADAEASRVRLMAKADGERMASEAELLNKSPLLINKIIAERLSDKIQVLMVPSDGKFFFANDVFKGAASSPIIKQEMDSENQPGPKSGGH